MLDGRAAMHKRPCRTRSGKGLLNALMSVPAVLALLTSRLAVVGGAAIVAAPPG